MQIKSQFIHANEDYHPLLVLHLFGLEHLFYKKGLVLGQMGWKHRNLYSTLNQVYLVHCLDHDYEKLFGESKQKTLK